MFSPANEPKSVGIKQGRLVGVLKTEMGKESVTSVELR